MEKYKKLRLSLITLLLALVLALTAAVFVINGRGAGVYAATSDYFVELDGNSVFYTAIHGAEIEASEPIGEGEDASRYTLFKIGDEQTVSYRQNLAYKWITASGNEDGEPETKHFSMTLRFPETNFKMFYIKFESQQYTLTEEGKSTNYIIFAQDTGEVNKDKWRIKTSTTLDVDEEYIASSTEGDVGGMLKTGAVTLGFGEYNEGDYKIKMGVPGYAGYVTTRGRIKNVSENFASYVASGDNAVTPITFGAVFDEDDEVKEAQVMLVDINGQSFEMHKQSNDTYKIKDTAAPVLCFSQTPSYLEYGKTIGFQYSVIDVLANISGNSSRATAYYYVLTGDQVKNAAFEYDKIDYSESTDKKEEGEENEGEEGETTEKPTNPFKKVTSSSSERIYPDKNTFIPSEYLKSDVMGLVKIYYELSDRASTSTAHTDTVFVEWYIKEALGENNNALVDVSKYNNNKEGATFIKLIKNKEGATYAQSEDATYDEYKQSVSDFQSEYQAKIDAAIKDLEKDEDGNPVGKLYAGGKKFYLPAIEWDFLDDYLTGTDYKYSLYYRGSSSGSNASLASNKLAIDLNDADVTYRFTIFITDAFGNPMRYPTEETDDNGNIIWGEIKTSDVWDEDFSELLPYFEFEVSYKEATAEPPENLSISYVKSSYSGVTFKITGVSGTYTSKYKLYVFDRNAYYKDKNEVLDYDTFVSKTQEIFDNPETRKYFTTVKPVKDLLESDENYDLFKSLNWNATSISFTPQSVEDFYVVELQLTDNRSQASEAYYATVASSVQTKSLKGESEWLEYNKTSIILFVIAGVCLIALIVLLIIKPKDKGDIDAIYSEVEAKDKEGGKNQKKEKSNK